MISIDSLIHPCKNLIQTTIHEPLQIRTIKHRCFIFGIGHTSLTCVPGIGKKNKYLLNRSGIRNLSTLYSKYRSINNSEDFKQWLQNEVGFTSYQAKMTTCGIGSKLGEIKEIDTGLLPICCSIRERREEKQKLFTNDRNIHKRNRNITSEEKKTKNEAIKKAKTGVKSESEDLPRLLLRDQIEPKQENLLSNESINEEDVIISQENDQSFSSSNEKLSNNSLTHIESPDHQTLTNSFTTKLQSDLSSSSPHDLFSDRKHQDNPLSETKLHSSSITDSTDSLELTKHSSPSSKKNSKPNDSLIKTFPPYELIKSDSSSNPIQSKQSAIDSKLDLTLDSIEENPLMITSSNHSSQTNVELINSGSYLQQQTKNKLVTQKSSSEYNSETKLFNATLSSQLSMENTLTPEVSDTSANTISQHSTVSTEQNSSSKEMKPMPSSNFDKSSKLQSNLEKKGKPMSSFEEKATKLNLFNDEKLNQTSPLTEQKLQLTSNVLQDERDEIMSAPKSISNASIDDDEYDRKSILRHAQFNSISQLQTDTLLSTTKQEEEPIFKVIPSPKTRWKKTAVNYGLDSALKSNSNETSLTKINDKTATVTILPTPAIIKSNVHNLTTENKLNQQTSSNDELSTDDRTSSSKSTPTIETKKEEPQTHGELPPVNSDADINIQKKPIYQLSNSKLSTDKINSLIDKTKSDSSNFEEEANIKRISNSAKVSSIPPKEFTDTSVSTTPSDNPLFNNLIKKNQLQSLPSTDEDNLIEKSKSTVDQEKQSLPAIQTIFDHNKTNESNNPFISSDRTDHVPRSYNIEEKQFLDKNLSETLKSNHQLEIIRNSTDSTHQTTTTSPSFPIPCSALWDNISNEKILPLCKKHRLKYSKKNPHNQNSNDHNQNSHSSTTLLTFITRQQYFEERQTLNEHIFYIKRIIYNTNID